MANEYCLRDPVHNYIYLTEVEAKLVKHELFQRLRFITQNGAVYYTYPSNRNCRFMHSLGCMQIAGDIFLSATENIYDNDIRQYFLDSFKIIDSICKNQLMSSLKKIVTEFIARRDKTFLKYGLDLSITEDQINTSINNSNFQIRFSRAVLFQGLRLACALHDVGHFPFSHALERAIQNHLEFSEMSTEIYDELSKGFENTKTADKHIHEKIGVKILETVLPTDDEPDFHKLFRYIALHILNGTVDDEAYLVMFYPLRTVVSGEVDADRLDYCLRDPNASGLELGAYDLERLINNFILSRFDGIYNIYLRSQALSSIESFFHQRYLLYKYLIYHHSKVRMDKVIEEITCLLIKCYFDEVKPIQSILEDFNFRLLWTGFKDYQYYFCNENWYLTLLQRIYIKCGEPASLDVKKLHLLIKIFLFRQIEHIYSFFKRYDHFRMFMDQVEDEIKAKEVDVDTERLKRVIVQALKSSSIKDLQKAIYEKHNVICLFADTPPVGIKDLKLIQERIGKKELISVNILSPYIDSLNNTFIEDQFFNIFLIRENIKKHVEVINSVKREIIDFILSEYLS